MSLETNVTSAFTRVATEFKTLRTSLTGNNSGSLAGLTTTAKSSLIAAINELDAAVDALASAEGGATIVDGAPSGTSVWSSSKTDTEIDAAVSAAVAALLDSAPGALDTLNELAAALGDDPDFAGTITASLASKVVGPASSVNNDLAVFDGTTGKLLADSGVNLASVVRTADDQTIGGVKTLTSSPIMPTPTAGDNSTKGATTAFVTTAVAGATIPDASETVKGKVEIATNTEAQAGVSAAVVLTPANLASVVGTSGTDFVATFEAGLV